MPQAGEDDADAREGVRCRKQSDLTGAPRMSDTAFLSTVEFGRRVGMSATSAWRVCQRHPGFAIRAGGTYRIPVNHAERVERGERPDEIAANARRHSSPVGSQ